MLKITETKKKIIWYTLLVVAFTGLLLMIIQTYALPGDGRYLDKDGNVIGEPWYDELILPFYFTFDSNVMGFVIALTWTFNLIKNRRIKKRLEILTIVNLTLTLIVYWTMLFPLGQPGNALGWISNLIVHLFVPLLAILAFSVENIVIKNNVTFSWWKDALWHLIFPLVWLIVAMIIYISLDFRSTAAIYPFLDVAHNPVWMTIVIFIGIAIFYIALTMLVIHLSNKKNLKKRVRISKSK